MRIRLRAFFLAVEDLGRGLLVPPHDVVVVLYRWLGAFVSKARHGSVGMGRT